MKEAIGDAENSKFSEFSKKVKTSLEDKLRNNPKMMALKAKQDELDKVKQAFTQIAKKDEPKEDPVVPAEPAPKNDDEPANEPDPAPAEPAPSAE